MLSTGSATMVVESVVLAVAADPPPDTLTAFTWAILGGLIGLSATGLTAELLRERYWPSSAVRLAMLPASITGSDADSLPIINGFLQDLSYSLNRSEEHTSELQSL